MTIYHVAISKSYVGKLLRNHLVLIRNCTHMPLSGLEQDKQLMIVGFFFMRKLGHAPNIHATQVLAIFIAMTYRRYECKSLKNPRGLIMQYRYILDKEMFSRINT